MRSNIESDLLMGIEMSYIHQGTIPGAKGRFGVPIEPDEDVGYYEIDNLVILGVDCTKFFEKIFFDSKEAAEEDAKRWFENLLNIEKGEKK